MNKDEAWALVEMMQDYFDSESAIDAEGEPNKEMQFRDACEKLLTFLEKLP